MRLVRTRNDEDLTREPTVEEALADPVVQAVMARDRVSRDDVLHVVRAAQARLRAPHSVGLKPFPARAVRASATSAERRQRPSIRPEPIGLGDIDLRLGRRCRGGSSLFEE
jgi:hypothetical protein